MEAAITDSFTTVDNKADKDGTEDYLGASLRFMAEDTRGGISLSAKRDFNAIRERAKANPENRTLKEYVAKFAPPLK